MYVCDSYKEQSEGSTDSEDLIDAFDQADDAASQDETDAETIEKVIRHRIGRKGGMYRLMPNALTFAEQEELVFLSCMALAEYLHSCCIFSYEHFLKGSMQLVPFLYVGCGMSIPPVPVLW